MAANPRVALGIVAALVIVVGLLGVSGVVSLSVAPTCNAVGCNGFNTGAQLYLVPTIQQNGLQVNFTDHSSVHVGGNGVVTSPGWTVRWFNLSWGDGRVNTLIPPTTTLLHVYGAAGNYTLTESAFATGPTTAYPCPLNGPSSSPPTGSGPLSNHGNTCYNTSSVASSQTWHLQVPPPPTTTCSNGWTVVRGVCTPPPLVAGLTVSYTWHTAGLVGYFTGVLYQNNVTVSTANIQFAWGDGSSNTTGSSFTYPANATTVHTFPATGTYSVTLRAGGAPFGGVTATPTIFATTTHAVSVVKNVTTQPQNTTMNTSVAVGPNSPTLGIGIVLFGAALLALAILPGMFRIVVTVLLVVLSVGVFVFAAVGGVI